MKPEKRKKQRKEKKAKLIDLREKRAKRQKAKMKTLSDHLAELCTEAFFNCPPGYDAVIEIGIPGISESLAEKLTCELTEAANEATAEIMREFNLN